MAKKPSERRNFKQEEMELNITPMMNLIAILIPCLLVSVAFVELAVANVAAPSIGEPDQSNPPPPTDHPPINLMVTITDKGYTVSGAIDIFETGSATTNSLFIPTVEKTVTCARYLDTVPPPRRLNRGAVCRKSEDSRSFVLYDTTTLTTKLVDVKDKFADETRIIIAADPDTDFEPIVDVMDAARDVGLSDGTVRNLFDEVVFSPGQN